MRAIRFAASLPQLKSVLYVRNHHFIELTDEQGNTIRLIAKSMIRGLCKTCGQTIYAETRSGAMTCPHCFGAVGWVWGKAQISFVPEDESSFSMPAMYPDPPIFPLPTPARLVELDPNGDYEP